MRYLFAAAATLAFAIPAAAQDRVVDISTPEAIAKVMQEEGYKAAVKKGDSGAKFIDSAAHGKSFTVQMFNCSNEKGCTSAQFYTWFKKKPGLDAAFANRWNAKKRFIKAAIDKDGDLSVYMDFSTLGKTTYANAADIVDWWALLLGGLVRAVEDPSVDTLDD